MNLNIDELFGAVMSFRWVSLTIWKSIISMVSRSEECNSTNLTTEKHAGRGSICYSFDFLAVVENFLFMPKLDLILLYLAFQKL